MAASALRLLGLTACAWLVSSFHRAAKGNDGQATSPAVQRCVQEYADSLDGIRPGLGADIRSHPLTARGTSFRQLLLGAGSGTTGHRSLVTALRLLNVNSSYHALEPWKNKYFRTLDFSKISPAKCQSALRDFDYTTVPEHADAIFDTPVAELFLNFFLAFPKAKVLLSTRPAANWAARRTQAAHGMMSPLPMQEPCGEFIGNHRQNLNEVAALFEANNQLVRCLVPPERLLEVNLWQDTPSQMQGLMRRLSEFVGVPLAGSSPAPLPVRYSRMDENPDWPGNKCEPPQGATPGSLVLASGVFGASEDALWTSRVGSTMQALARAECDMVF